MGATAERGYSYRVGALFVSFIILFSEIAIEAVPSDYAEQVSKYHK